MLNVIQRVTIALRTRLEREEGQTLVEYALIIALVSVALIAALNALAVDIGEIFGRIGTALDGAGGGGGGGS